MKQRPRCPYPVSIFKEKFFWITASVTPVQSIINYDVNPCSIVIKYKETRERLTNNFSCFFLC